MDMDMIENTGHDKDYIRVMKKQKQDLEDTIAESCDYRKESEKIIDEAGEILEKYETFVPKTVSLPEEVSPSNEPLKLRPWEEICAEAGDEEASISDLLSAEEIAKIQKEHKSICDKFDLDHRLDKFDWGIAALAGSLAALVDILLVKVPSSPGLAGGAATKGGALSDLIRNHFRGMYSSEEQKALEQIFKVPYDASTSASLETVVEGLGPRTHRFQSLGHDPLLGFFYGVRDIMRGQMTAIDKFGKTIVQNIPSAERGISLFKAIAIQFGHLKSDIGTPSGLPVPGMPLLQKLQIGNINGRTIGELSRTMYAKGYDFGHFCAMSIPVLMIEVLVRLLYFVKRRYYEKKTFEESLPINIPFKPRQPKLQTMLFTAHAIATAVNAGKVYLTKNPLSINFPQWLRFIQLSYSQIRWVVFTKNNERLQVVQNKIDNDWQEINKRLEESWTFVE